MTRPEIEPQPPGPLGNSLLIVIYDGVIRSAMIISKYITIWYMRIIQYTILCFAQKHQLHLCRGVRPSNECPGYDTKQSDGEVWVMLELWGMQSTPSLPVPDPLWSGKVAPDRALSMGWIELNCILMLN